MSIGFEEFVDQASIILDLNLWGYKIKRVQRRTESVMRRYGIRTYEECLELLKNDADFRLSYLDHFTINTSEFFRNPKNFDYLRDNIIDNLFRENEKVKIWSAPCSNGSEPYSIAILLTEKGYKESDYQILASDIDVNILESARKGVYNNTAVQNIPYELLNKYFEISDDNYKRYRLKEEIKRKVTFEQKDLITEPFEKDWNLIICRNFFIYLTTDIKESLTHKFSESLVPGGYLFLGNIEFIFHPEKYNLEKVYSSFYRKKQ